MELENEGLETLFLYSIRAEPWLEMPRMIDLYAVINRMRTATLCNLQTPNKLNKK